MKIIRTGTKMIRKCTCNCIFEYNVDDIYTSENYNEITKVVFCPECGNKINIADSSKFVNEELLLHALHEDSK